MDWFCKSHQRRCFTIAGHDQPSCCWVMNTVCYQAILRMDCQNNAQQTLL